MLFRYPAGDGESHQRDTVSVDVYREVFHVTHFPGDSGHDLNTLSVSAAAGGRRGPTGPTLRSCMRFPSCAAPNPHIPAGHQAAEETARMRTMPTAHFPARTEEPGAGPESVSM